LDSENKSNYISKNVGYYKPMHTASYLRILEFGSLYSHQSCSALLNLFKIHNFWGEAALLNDLKTNYFKPTSYVEKFSWAGKQYDVHIANLKTEYKPTVFAAAEEPTLQQHINFTPQ